MKEKQMSVWMAGACVVAALALAPGAADAQRGRGRDPQDGRGPAVRERIQERLDLSDQLKERLRDIAKTGRQEAVLRRGKLADLHAQLRAELMNDEVDKTKVRGLSRQISDLRAQAAEARLEHRLAARDILSADQREELRRMAADRRPFMRDRMHGRGMRGRGGCGLHEGPGCGEGPGRGWGMHLGFGPGADLEPGMGAEGAPGFGLGPGFGWGAGDEGLGLGPDPEEALLFGLVPGSGPGPCWMDGGAEDEGEVPGETE